MALTNQIDFTIINSTYGSNWGGKIKWTSAQIETTTLVVSDNNATLPDAIEITSGVTNTPIQFEPAFILYYSGSGTKYVTWRSQNDSQQFPLVQSGQSLDLWSDDLYDDIVGNVKWQDLIDHVPYNLSTNKTSLYYNYSPPYPEQFNKGGTIAFTFVTPP